MTFLSDAGEVRVGAFQLTFWCADRALKRRRGLLGLGITPPVNVARIRPIRIPLIVLGMALWPMLVGYPRLLRPGQIITKSTPQD